MNKYFSTDKARVVRKKYLGVRGNEHTAKIGKKSW